MRSPKDAPSEMLFFLFNTIQECLLYLSSLRNWLVDFDVFQCNLNPKPVPAQSYLMP